jgi:DNA-binding NarL/FixJ family response regulator
MAGDTIGLDRPEHGTGTRRRPGWTEIGVGLLSSAVLTLDGLTTREVEILGLIAQGLSNREIGRVLFIGMATVKTHINHLLTKTAQRDRAQRVSYAYRNHLTPP